MHACRIEEKEEAQTHRHMNGSTASSLADAFGYMAFTPRPLAFPHAAPLHTPRPAQSPQGPRELQLQLQHVSCRPGGLHPTTLLVLLVVRGPPLVGGVPAESPQLREHLTALLALAARRHLHIHTRTYTHTCSHVTRAPVSTSTGMRVGRQTPPRYFNSTHFNTQRTPPKSSPRPTRSDQHRHRHQHQGQHQGLAFMAHFLQRVGQLHGMASY